MKKTFLFSLGLIVAFVSLFISCSEDETILDSQETESKYNAIDLGLPSGRKWATCNVGASSPEEYGGYYAWGETEEKSNYDWSTYKWCNGSENTMTKYCIHSYYGTVDNKTVLDPEDDVAHIKWGGDWRMPTTDEQRELLNNCDWEWTTLNGVKGYKVIGPNGNSIFLPAAGFRYGTDIDDRVDNGNYWSSSLYCNDEYFAYNSDFYCSTYDYWHGNRSLGRTVRPVLGATSSKPVNSCTVSVSSNGCGIVNIEDKEELSTTVFKGSKVTVVAVPDEDYYFSGWYLGNSEEPISTESTYTFTVNEDMALLAKFLIPAYGEGLTIISKDKDGKSMLSFMQAPIVEGGIGTFIDGDCFTINNPNIDFASEVADIVQCNGSLIIACQGGSENGDLPTIYYLNENTLVMEDMITVSEYDDFKPVKLAFPRKIYKGVSYPILCDNGKVYDFEITEGVVLESIKMQSTYSQACFVENNEYSHYNILFWDKEVNAATLIYNGYGPYCYGQKYLLERDDPEFNYFNYFNGIKGLITLTEIRCTNEQVETSERETLILLQGKFTAQKLVIPTFPWRYVEDTAYMTFVDNGGLKTIGTKVPLDENTPCVANRTYQSLLFADGNKVRRWYYTSNVQINKADTFDLGLSDDAVITAIEISEDHRKTYIAFYEPNQEDKNGSVWVISTDTGEVLEKYNNVCYQPVKMIYKKK